MLTKTHSITKVFFCLCWKPTNNICSNGDTRYSRKKTNQSTSYDNKIIVRPRFQSNLNKIQENPSSNLVVKAATLLRFLFLSTSWQMLGQYFKLSHDLCLPYPTQLANLLLATMCTAVACCLLKCAFKSQVDTLNSFHDLFLY